MMTKKALSNDRQANAHMRPDETSATQSVANRQPVTEVLNTEDDDTPFVADGIDCDNDDDELLDERRYHKTVRSQGDVRLSKAKSKTPSQCYPRPLTLKKNALPVRQWQKPRSIVDKPAVKCSAMNLKHGYQSVG